MNNWYNLDADEMEEEISKHIEQLKLEIRLFQRFLEEKQDELADLGERQDMKFMPNLQDFTEKGNESIRNITLSIENFKKSHLEKSKLNSFKKLDREFNDLYTVFESQCDPETFGFDVDKYYENKIALNKTDSGREDINQSPNPNYLSESSNADKNQSFDRSNSSKFNKNNSLDRNITTNSNKDLVMKEFNSLIAYIDIVRDVSERDEDYKKLAYGIKEFKSKLEELKAAKINEKNFENLKNKKENEKIITEGKKTWTEKLSNIDYNKVQEASKTVMTGGKSLWGMTSNYLKNQMKSGGVLDQLKENIKESFLSADFGEDGYGFHGYSRNSSRSNSRDSGSLTEQSESRGNNQIIFHGTTLKDIEFNNPKQIKAVFGEKVDIINHSWQFSYDELRNRILNKKLLSIYIDAEEETAKSPEHLHAIVFSTPNYAVSFNMNFGLNYNDKFTTFVNDVLSCKSLIKIVFDYKVTLNRLKNNLYKQDSFNKISEIVNYHDLNNYTEKEGQNRYFSKYNSSEIKLIRPMAERWLNVALDKSLPNWCNEDKCSDFDKVSNVFARAYIMIEFYKFFQKNIKYLDTEDVPKVKYADLDISKKYLVDIYLIKDFYDLKNKGYDVHPPNQTKYRDLLELANAMDAYILTSDIYFANYHQDNGKVLLLYK